MAEYMGSVLTNVGLQLQTKVQMGAPLRFTRIAIGDGFANELKVLTELVNETISLPILELKKIQTGQVQAKSVLTNQGRAEGIYVREIGLFATDPDLGEILYCVANAGVKADYLPPDNGVDVVEEIINMITVIGEATEVTAIVPEQAFVTIDQLMSHVDNPDIHITRAEFDSKISALRNEVQLIKATFPDTFQHNLLTEDLVTLDAITLTSGYYNEAKTRLEL